MRRKSELRTELQALLANSHPDEHNQVLSELTNLIRGAGESSTVLLYKPVKKWHEFDLTSLPDLLPNVSFEFVGSEKDTEFPKKKYDATIIPLLGFNKNGYRLGHGGGWYDRFLREQPQALKIGVGYEHTLVDFAPEPHDVRMDIVVTETQIRRFHKG